MMMDCEVRWRNKNYSFTIVGVVYNYDVMYLKINMYNKKYIYN